MWTINQFFDNEVLIVGNNMIDQRKISTCQVIVTWGLACRMLAKIFEKKKFPSMFNEIFNTYSDKTCNEFLKSAPTILETVDLFEIT